MIFSYALKNPFFRAELDNDFGMGVVELLRVINWFETIIPLFRTTGGTENLEESRLKSAKYERFLFKKITKKNQ